MHVSRRKFGTLAAVLAAGVAGPGRKMAAQTATPQNSASDRSFPRGFTWGSATASYQVEGAIHEDGRGVSIWDTFSHTTGKTHNGDTGDIATDSYHRFAEDIALMKSYGLTACRFSVAWPRIFPNGTGQPNQKGIDFYRRYCEALHAAGIEPFCTLYHWDLPQTLQDKGGWLNRDTAQAFADYSGYTASRLGSLVTHYMTMNELASFIDIGYRDGRHAPGLKLSPAQVAQARHHAVLGHGLAVTAIRAHAPAGTKIGFAENPRNCIPAFNAPEHIAAARKAFVEENAAYTTVMQTGQYRESYLRRLGTDAPKFTPEDMRSIGAKTDFVGLNVYTATPVLAADNERGYIIPPKPTSYPHMASPWLTVGPEALYWIPRFAAEELGASAIYITENGCSANDVVAKDGEVYDTDRVMYLNAYLTQLQRAVSQGVPIRGYFCWSLLDNYEWADGYEKRFGITYVDFATQKRTPKVSAKFYANLIQRNGL